MDETTTNQPLTNEWKYGKFSCMEDIPGCLCAMFLAPCYNYKAVEAATGDTCKSVLACIFPLTICCVRTKVRESKGIDGSAMGDCASVLFCGCCTAVQLKREFD